MLAFSAGPSVWAGGRSGRQCASCVSCHCKAVAHRLSKGSLFSCLNYRPCCLTHDGFQTYFAGQIVFQPEFFNRLDVTNISLKSLVYFIFCLGCIQRRNPRKRTNCEA